MVTKICALRQFVPITVLMLSTLLLPIAGHADYVYVANFFGNNILKYDASGNMSVFASGLSGVHGVAVDGNGNVYTASANDGRLMKFSSNGQGTQLGLAATYWFQAIACDNNGNVYCAENNNIIKFDSAGNESTFVNGGTLGFSSIMGLAFDGAGNLYASGLGSSGFLLQKYDSSGRGSTFSSTVPANPMGLAFDASGNLFVAGFSYGQIFKYDSAGQATVFASLTGLSGPIGLGFDSDNNLYVANKDSSTVVKFDAIGNKSVFATGLFSPCYLAVQVVPEPCVSSMLVGFGATLGLLRSRQTR